MSAVGTIRQRLLARSCLTAAALMWACAFGTAAEGEPDGSLNNVLAAGEAAPDKGREQAGDASDKDLLMETLKRGIVETTAALETVRKKMSAVEGELLKAREMNAGLQDELERKLGAIKALTESLAVAQTETELFRRKYEEQRLLLQALGKQATGEGEGLEKKFGDLLRALEQSEAAQQELRTQLGRVIEIAEALLPVAAEGPEAKKLREKIIGELTHAKEVARAEKGEARGQNGIEHGSLENATIIKVNEDLQLAVLNVGRTQGVRVGMQFYGMKDKRVSARLTVVEVRERICGAVISEQRVSVQAGDKVRLEKSQTGILKE